MVGRWCVAAGAGRGIYRRVVEVDGQPVAGGGVACFAGAGVVVDGRFVAAGAGAVADLAVVEVVDDGEIVGVDMAAGAGGRKVVGGRFVAVGAFLSGHAAMVEVYDRIIVGADVAAGAGGGEVVFRGLMAADAILGGDIGVVEGDLDEGARFLVTGLAGAGVVAWRRFVALRAVAGADAAVVENGVGPADDGMAGGAVGPVKPLVNVIFGVTAAALDGETNVGAVAMTGVAANGGMTADQREEIMVAAVEGNAVSEEVKADVAEDRGLEVCGFGLGRGEGQPAGRVPYDGAADDGGSQQHG